jgi:hemoglobin-like flavoprotein
MTTQIQQIQESFSLISADRERFKLLFYGALSKLSPTLESQILEDDRIKTRQLFYSAVEVLMKFGDRPELLERKLGDLKRACDNIILRPEFRSPLKEAFLTAMAEFMGNRWGSDQEKAWDETLDYSCAIFALADSREREPRPVAITR